MVESQDKLYNLLKNTGKFLVYFDKHLTSKRIAIRARVVECVIPILRGEEKISIFLSAYFSAHFLVYCTFFDK